MAADDRWTWVQQTQSFLHASGKAAVWRSSDGKWTGHGSDAMGKLLVVSKISRLERDERHGLESSRKAVSF